jgi:hypothetical protein
MPSRLIRNAAHGSGVVAVGNILASDAVSTADPALAPDAAPVVRPRRRRTPRCPGRCGLDQREFGT